MPCADRKTKIGIDNRAEIEDIVIVVKRFTRSHDDDIVYSSFHFIQLLLNIHDFADHFTGTQISLFFQ